MDVVRDEKGSKTLKLGWLALLSEVSVDKLSPCQLEQPCNILGEPTTEFTGDSCQPSSIQLWVTDSTVIASYNLWLFLY